MLQKKSILDVGITNATKQEVLEYIVKGLEKNGKKYFIVTPNPEILVLASKAEEYRKILNRAEVAIPDGIGVIFAGKILRISLKERITGVELLESLCKAAAKKPITVGFLGGGEGIAERTSECLQLRYPQLKVVFAGSEWPKTQEDTQGKIENRRLKVGVEVRKLKIDKKINLPSSTIKNQPSTLYHPSSSIDILFVAFGAPKQEIWISENLDKIPVKVAIGVGGAFDYISGKVPRAPVWVRRLGFEWLFRLLVQPWRLKRQLALLEFVFLVLREKFLPRHSGKSVS